MKPNHLRSRILRITESPEGIREDELANLATAYRELVENANARLSLCGAWLRQGLRSEALHAAEQPPDLLELFAALDLGEKHGEWKQLCAANGIDSQADVDWHAAGEVNEAYDVERSLKRLLRRHRLGALARIPLKERLKTLRRLCEADASNPIWEQDLRTFERARFSEINREAKRAYDQEDLKTLVELEAELREDHWKEQPSSALVAAVRRCRAEVNQKQALGEYERLAKSIHTAWGGADRPAVEQLRQSWFSVIQNTGVEPPAELVGEIEPAFDWLLEIEDAERTELEFGESCRRLEEALDDRAPIEIIERRYADVVRFERGVNDVLQHRVHTRLQHHQLQKRRRFRVTALGVVGAIALAAGLVGWMLWQSARATEIEEWRSRVAVTLEENGPNAAARLLDQLQQASPAILAAAPLQQLKIQVEEELQRDAMRRDAFVAAIEAAEAAPLEEPNTDAIARATELASGEDETLRVNALKDRVEATRLRLQRERDDAFSAALDILRERHGTLIAERNDASGDAEGLRSLEPTAGELEREAKALVQRDGISAELIDAGQTLSSSISATARGIATERLEREAMVRALERIGSMGGRTVPSLLSDLTNFVNSYPETALSQQFAHVLRHEAAFLSVHQWYELNGRSALSPLTDPTAATELEERLKAYIAQHSRGPYEAALPQYVQYVAAARNTGDSSLAPSLALEPILSNKLISQLKMMRLADGTRLYTIEGEITQMQGGVNVTKVIRSAAEVDDPAATRSKLVMGNQLPEDPVLELSPQAQWAQTAESILSAQWEWEQVCLDLLDRLLAQNEMDPVVQLILAVRLAELHTAINSWHRDNELQQWLVKAKAVDVNVPWMKPEEDAQVREARQLASTVLDEAPAVSDIRQRLVATRSQLFGKLQPMRLAGIIWLDEHGEVEAKAKGETQTLEILVFDPNAREYRFDMLAEKEDDGEFRLPNGEGNVALGTPLFARVGRAGNYGE